MLPRSFTFRRRHRLTHALQYQAVYAARVKAVRGPLAAHALPNGLPHPRLGLAIGRAVGNAVVRNRLKRLLRESFRRLQHEVPGAPGAGAGSFDIVVSARAHRALSQEECQRLLAELITALHREWGRRAARRGEAGTSSARGPAPP